ncbi:hypothetical protein RJ641_002042 [Dillenia turbinata]|uniref:Uncharacterized protein n=1 Tax=Dillenia turbinata TaxID=194707 RepID=A0AAN8ZFX0_9MAGN
MSKKKAFSGSTMTLKDFHGGSIPSDLPLPSAPGVIVRPSDRSGFDRQGGWGNRQDHHRLRPGSSGSTRNFDEKTPFFSHNTHIGRNFDEDERKPLDGVSAPRRTFSDESIQAPVTRVETRVSSRQVATGGGSHFPGSSTGSHGLRYNEPSHPGLNPPNSVGGSYPNAWTARKEAAAGVAVNEPVHSVWIGGSVPVSKFAQASALEKVSSGMWQTKLASLNQMESENVGHSEMPSGTMRGNEYYDASSARHAERSLTVEDGSRGYERVRSPVYPEEKDRGLVNYNDGVKMAPSIGSDLQQALAPEVSERPKLKLLPRTKPSENLEPPAVDRQVYQPQLHIESACVDSVSELHGNVAHSRPGSAGPESGNRAGERPKLNLKPRTQPIEQLEGISESERKALFGGARPRELVLKERGIDDLSVTEHDLGQPQNRVKFDASKTQTISAHATSIRYGGKVENPPLDHRIGKTNERRDDRVDVERGDAQRRNWRNDNRRNIRENEKPQQQGRPPSPETWRKLAEPPKQDPQGLRFGKAASALELAQAFSKSVSDPKAADRVSGQRGLPGRTQIPFSRLTGPSPRPQINGY